MMSICNPTQKSLGGVMIKVGKLYAGKENKKRKVTKIKFLDWENDWEISFLEDNGKERALAYRTFLRWLGDA